MRFTQKVILFLQNRNCFTLQTIKVKQRISFKLNEFIVKTWINFMRLILKSLQKKLMRTFFELSWGGPIVTCCNVTALPDRFNLNVVLHRGWVHNILKIKWWLFSHQILNSSRELFVQPTFGPEVYLRVFGWSTPLFLLRSGILFMQS